ncbi:MAG: 30S ribosomal protein S3 [Candidatus Pacebacteria bacterium]|nr:30S ribosomal protein S3 [Candidatus Paceibacterota bacterium]
MAHKAHPKGLRLGYIENWKSRWFNDKNFSKILEEDFIIREFLKKKLKDAVLSKVEIERSPGKVLVLIYTARPGLIIGRGGRGVEELQKLLLKEILKKSPLKNEKRQIQLEIKEIRNPWIDANLVAQWVAQRLEKRIPYRRVLKQALEKVTSYKEVGGAKIEVSGRLNGVTIARREWLQKGRLPRQTLRADIDYGFCEAYCTYGVIGVKVWIYKGEKFE